MSLDLNAYRYETAGEARAVLTTLLTGLCLEAGVCLHDTKGPGNPVAIREAVWDVLNGLQVTDGDGVTYRLRVTAERCPSA